MCFNAKGFYDTSAKLSFNHMESILIILNLPQVLEDKTKVNILNISVPVILKTNPH